MYSSDVYKQGTNAYHHYKNYADEKMQIIAHIGHAVNVAIERFMAIGEMIADDNPEIKSEMYESCRKAKEAGKSIKRLCENLNADNFDYTSSKTCNSTNCTNITTNTNNTNNSSINTSCNSPCNNLRNHDEFTLAARTLLSSITRILLLVDIVVVKQLLTTKKQIPKSMEKLDSVIHFTEFVRAFSEFAKEMVELAYLTGSQSNLVKSERRRTQMNFSRQIIERSITILLTSSKASLMHHECIQAKENRDTVFCQIRQAIELIHFVIKDSIFDSAWFTLGKRSLYLKNNEYSTIFSIIKQLHTLLNIFQLRMQRNESSNVYKGNNNYPHLINDTMLHEPKTERNAYLNCNSELDEHGLLEPLGCNQHGLRYPIDSCHKSADYHLPCAEIRERLYVNFEKLMEKTYDFTDSAYTSHENRQNILLLCDNCKIEFNNYLQTVTDELPLRRGHTDVLLRAVRSLSRELVQACIEQVADLYKILKTCTELVNDLQSVAIKTDLYHMQEVANKYNDYCDHIVDICKLLPHIALTETLQVHIKFLAIHLRIYAPQILTAAQVLLKYPSSAPAIENFAAFKDMWKWISTEILTTAQQIVTSTNITNEDGMEYQHVKRKKEVVINAPLKSNTGSSALVESAANTGVVAADDGSQDLNVPSDKWSEDLLDNNDIFKRAKNLSAMAFLMYQFTKGCGTLKTTQDLFTQAEYFAEEANRLYKVVRQFSYQVPASEQKKTLLGILDRVPSFVQSLQFTVKDHTVGKDATFVKVDQVIKETKNLMSLINKVVSECFDCANKYKLDFNSISGMSAGTMRGDSSDVSGLCDSKGTTQTSEGSM